MGVVQEMYETDKAKIETALHTNLSQMLTRILSSFFRSLSDANHYAPCHRIKQHYL